MYKIQTIAQIHDLSGYEKPAHPLVSLIHTSKIPRRDIPEIQQKVISELYVISLKNGRECKLRYGRENYDFQEGSMMFIAPNQAVEPLEGTQDSDDTSWNGWVLMFHPDLISGTSLAETISEYTFFSYESREALHLSEQERLTVTRIVESIEAEYRQNIDVFSQELIVSNISLLLNYCKRFYGRQFITRANVNKDILIRFESFLRSYFDSEELTSNGLPSVKYCASKMGYSPNYLSDLLKRETGKNTQEHIHYHLIEKAKTKLLGTNEPVSQIAFKLGFEYPQHFSKLFKSKTGLSPAKYRN